MSEKKYSKEHEWITVEGDVGTVGITKHAAEMLGDVVFVELPEKGKNVEKDSQIGVVESTKAASDVYTPVSGEITAGNQSIVDDPSTVNKDPEGSAWFFKIKIKNKNDLNTLMKQSDYDKFVKENPS
tara:strand:+ start:450 stop:830 length:381 start_codon:yes stop_codon:yes gene_type:complete